MLIYDRALGWLVYIKRVYIWASTHTSSKGTSCEIIHSSYLISILSTFHDPRGYLQHNPLFMLQII